jgi:hypothetical protein
VEKDSVVMNAILSATNYDGLKLVFKELGNFIAFKDIVKKTGFSFKQFQELAKVRDDDVAKSLDAQFLIVFALTVSDVEFNLSL